MKGNDVRAKSQDASTERRTAPRERASAAAELRSPAEGKLLKPKPRYCEINAGDHRQWGNDPRTAYPEPAKAIWQKCGNQADNESADRSKSSPSVPIHFGREEIQDRIGNIPGTMRAQKDNGLRGINGKQRETASMCNSVEQRKSCSVSKDEPAIRQNGHYDPKPPILFMT